MGWFIFRRKKPKPEPESLTDKLVEKFQVKQEWMKRSLKMTKGAKVVINGKEAILGLSGTTFGGWMVTLSPSNFSFSVSETFHDYDKALALFNEIVEKHSKKEASNADKGSERSGEAPQAGQDQAGGEGSKP